MAALGIVVALLSGQPAAQAHHATGPAFPAPTGLFAVQTTAAAVTLGWNSYDFGRSPDQIEILENGRKVGTVPGYATNYEVAGLRENSAYQFSTVAITGDSHSALSAPYNVIDGHIAPQVALNLADAAFDWTGSVGYKETYSSDKYWIEHVGDTWQDPWAVSTVCDSQACDATLNGSIDGISFIATLHRFGATYTGSAPINNFYSCGSTTNYEKSTLNIRLTVTNATKTAGQWYVAGFKGTLTWNVPYDPDPGCDASLYQMTVHTL
jgi:hypothetical protein